MEIPGGGEMHLLVWISSSPFHLIFEWYGWFFVHFKHVYSQCELVTTFVMCTPV